MQRGTDVTDDPTDRARWQGERVAALVEAILDRLPYGSSLMWRQHLAGHPGEVAVGYAADDPEGAGSLHVAIAGAPFATLESHLIDPDSDAREGRAVVVVDGRPDELVLRMH
jgi:hypothetical protein